MCPGAGAVAPTLTRTLAVLFLGIDMPLAWGQWHCGSVRCLRTALRPRIIDPGRGPHCPHTSAVASPMA